MATPQQLMAEIAVAQWGVVQRRQALDAGLTRAQVSHLLKIGAWSPVTEGVYRSSALPPTWESGLIAACLTGGKPAAASHRSAAELHGLPGGTRTLVEITSRRWSRSHRQVFVVHESLSFDSQDMTTIRGIPTTTVDRTLLDLGAVCGYLTVQMALDRAIRERKTSWQSVAGTLQRLARSGRPGVTKLRAALRSREGWNVPESEQETRLLGLISRSGLPDPEPQFTVFDDDGEFLARVDAAYPERRIAIEYDSDLHHSHAADLGRDNERRNRLIAAGWTVIAARNTDLRSGGPLLCRAIAAALESSFGA